MQDRVHHFVCRERRFASANWRFSGFVEARPWIREALPGGAADVWIRHGWGAPNPGGNTHGCPCSPGGRQTADSWGIQGADGSGAQPVSRRRLRGFRPGFADWACCGAPGERERRIPGARRARGVYIDTALMRRARGSLENARRAPPVRSCGGVFVRRRRRLCRTKPGCRPCVTRQGEAPPYYGVALLRRIGGAGARPASLPGSRGFRFEIEDCGFYGAPGEFAGESRFGNGWKRRCPRGGALLTWVRHGCGAPEFAANRMVRCPRSTEGEAIWLGMTAGRDRAR